MSCTVFDQLPNELIFKIVDYLTTIDAWIAFYDLNPRLNSLLQSHRASIDLSSCRKTQFDFARRCILKKIANPFAIKFCPRVTVESTHRLFSRLDSSNVNDLLQSLTLTLMSTQSMDVVNQHLRHLRNLRSLTIMRVREKSVGKFIVKIMSIKMPSLTYLKLGYTGRLSSLCFDEDNLDRLTLAVLSVQELILQVPMTLSVVHKFVSTLPAIMSIDVIVLERSDEASTGKSFHFKHTPPLQKLVVTMNGIILFKTMTKFLRDLSQLRTLWFSAFILDSVSGAEYHDGQAWKDLIRTYLSHLVDFRLNVGLEASESATPSDVIQTFCSSFWTVEKKWWFVADRPANDVDTIELYSLPPPAQGKVIFRPNVQWSSNSTHPSFKGVRTLGLLPTSERSASTTAQSRVYTNVSTIRSPPSYNSNHNHNVSTISKYVDLTKVANCVVNNSDLMAALPAMSHITSLTIQCYDGDVDCFNAISSPITTLKKLILDQSMRCYYCNQIDLIIITHLFPNLEYIEMRIGELESVLVLMNGLPRLVYAVLYNDPEMIDEKLLTKWLRKNEATMKFTWHLEDKRLDIWFD